MFRNDIYGTYLIDLAFGGAEGAQSAVNGSLNRFSISLIHPARPKDIEKYSDQEIFLVHETAELYQRVTKPYIEAQVSTPGHLQWLYNVLEHKAEVCLSLPLLSS